MKIKELINYEEKSKIKAGDAILNGKYPFFTSSEAEDKRYDQYTCDAEGIIMGTGGNATLHYYNGKFAVSTDCLVLKTNQNVKCKYLYYFFKANMKVLQDGFKGAGLKHTNKSYIENIDLNMLPNIKEQLIIIERLDKINNIIQKHKKVINYLDTLIKARFVEMFGDLNNTKYEIKTIEECAIFVKDGTHNTPMYTEDKINGFKFLSSKDVTSGKIDWSNIKYIPKELHNELYKRIKPQKNDILLAKNGTTGVCAIVDNDEIFDIYVSLALIRLKKNLNPTYIWTIINSHMVKEQFNKSLKGIGVPNLHLSEIKKVNLIVPPIDLQNTFAIFVNQVDKLKFDVQKSLEKTQMLFDSLMQEYFG